MRINNLEKNNNKLNFKNVGILAKPLGVFYDTNAVLPTFLIEGGVTSGRSAVAYKRGEELKHLTGLWNKAQVLLFGFGAFNF